MQARRSNTPHRTLAQRRPSPWTSLRPTRPALRPFAPVAAYARASPTPVLNNTKIMHPSDSYMDKVLPFATDSSLRSLYVNWFGDIRFGLLLEDFDRLAGAIAYKHALGSEEDVVKQLVSANSMLDTHEFTEPTLNRKKLVIVTAGCDSIQLYKPLSINYDLHMRGRVVHVGKSSMEIFLEVDAILGTKAADRVIEANFTMVARDENNQATSIRPLEPETPEEKELNIEAQANRDKRKRKQLQSLELQPPTCEEQALIHKMFTNRKKAAGVLPAGAIPLSATTRHSTLFMHPQKRNIHAKIFGGYLMRLAFEHGFSTAYLFSGSKPNFRAVDELNFIRPVEIGNICTFNATVIYAKPSVAEEDAAIVVEVVTNVIDPPSHKESTTNTFYFTFMASDCTKQVQPVTYEEAMKYLDGRRRYETVLENEKVDIDRNQKMAALKRTL